MDENQIEITLKFKVSEVNLILKTLAKQPFEEVAGLIQRIKTDGEAQVQAVVEGAEAPEAQPAEETATA